MSAPVSRSPKPKGCPSCGGAVEPEQIAARGEWAFCLGCQAKEAARPREVPAAPGLFDASSWETYYAVPAATVAAMMIQRSGLLELFFIPVVVQLHELGHAVHAWLTGRMAVPLIAVTMTGETSGRLDMFLVVAAALGGLFYWSRREGGRFLPVVAIALLAAQIYLTFSVTRQQQEMFMVFGGIAGQFYFSTLLVVAFFYEMPERMRWSYWRNVCLMLGMFAFEHSFAFWREVAAGRKELPRGSLMRGEGDTNGDINRLIAEHGWTEVTLTAAYNHIAKLCLMIIWGHYLWRLYRTTRPSAASRRDG